MTRSRPPSAADGKSSRPEPSLFDDNPQVWPDPDEWTGFDEVDLPRRRQRKRLLIMAGVAVVVLVNVALGVFLVSEGILGNVKRVPEVFESDTERPPSTEALTFVLAGVDSRSPGAETGTGRAGSDVTMIAQIDAARSGVTVVSLPHDLLVAVPGRGEERIGGVYSAGGPALLVRTVENLTGLRVDHFAAVDFAGFQQMVDAVGGIDVAVAAPMSDGGVQFQEGINHLDGAEALVYVRQRAGLPQGDITRAQRQQNALRALLTKATSGGMLSDPPALYDLLDATSRSIAVDDTLTNNDMRALALELRGLRPGNATFLNAPVTDGGVLDGRPTLRLDRTRAEELWAAMRNDAATGYLLMYPNDSLADAPA